MKIFISWSGERSNRLAQALKGWLSDFFQGDEIFMSTHDIEAGTRWSDKLNNELEKSNFGIMCLTPENLNAPWLLFEAGALSKTIDESHVVPYLLDIKPTDVAGPLSQFQGVTADELGTFKLLQCMNKFRQHNLFDEQLRKTFIKWWIDLKEQIESIPSATEIKQSIRSDRALLEEILQLVRTQSSSFLNSERAISLIGPGREITELSNEQLYKILEIYKDRWYETKDRSEEGYLENRIHQIKNELKSRNLTDSIK
jgi:hypothetical protein